MTQKLHVMHGRDHAPGGSDPIPGGGSGVDLSGYVLAAVPGLRNLWASGHGLVSSGAGAKTTLACSLALGGGPAPLASKFYDHTSTPVLVSPLAYSSLLGVSFRPSVASGVQVTGVQFWRDAGSGLVDVKLWRDSDDALLATKNAMSAVGWNEIYFDTPVTLGATSVDYTVGWSNPLRNTTTNATLPKTAGSSVATTSASPFRRNLTSGDLTTRPATGGNTEYYLGPIVNYTPDPVAILYVVATAAKGTAAGAYIIRTEIGYGVIDIYWSAPNVNVAAHVLALGLVEDGDGGGGGPVGPFASYAQMRASFNTYSALKAGVTTYADLT